MFLEKFCWFSIRQVCQGAKVKELIQILSIDVAVYKNMPLLFTNY